MISRSFLLLLFSFSSFNFYPAKEINDIVNFDQNGRKKVRSTQLYSTARVDIPTTQGSIPQHRSQKSHHSRNFLTEWIDYTSLILLFMMIAIFVSWHLATRP